MFFKRIKEIFSSDEINTSLVDKIEEEQKKLVGNIIKRSEGMPATVRAGIVGILTEEEIEKRKKEILEYDFTSQNTKNIKDNFFIRIKKIIQNGLN